MATPKYLSDNQAFTDERKRLVELRREATSSTKRMRKLIKDFETVEGLPAKIKDAQKSSSENQQEIIKLKKESSEAVKSARKALADAEKARDDIDKLLDKKKTDSQTITDQIDVIETINKSAVSASDSINRLREEIKNQLGSAVSGTLSNAFQERAKKISASKWVWFATLILLSSASPLIAVFVFTNIDASKVVGDNLIAMNVFRLGALSPLIFFIGYASVQYSREREIQEKYEFKASTAKSLPAYMKIIKEEFYDNGVIEGHEADLMKFAIKSINKNYEEPTIKRKDLDEISTKSKKAVAEGVKKISDATVVKPKIAAEKKENKEQQPTKS